MAVQEGNRGLSRRARRILLGMLVIGLLVRVVWAFKTYGITYDIDSYQHVDAALGSDPLHLYTTVNGDPFLRWPYPSGFLPFIWITHHIAELTGTPFHGWIQMPQILADLALAWLVQSYLGRRGATERIRLAAAALVALGPSFVLISGYHGQLDSMAILPAVVAVYVWDLLPPGWRRGLICGALVGVAAAMKTSPVLVLFALLPSARSNRERIALVVAAAAVPLLTLAPWLIADPHGTVDALRSHRALPGTAGISMLVQPDLAGVWLGGDNVPLSPLSQWIQDHQTAVAGLFIAPFAALLYLRRTAPAQAATVLWLAFYVFGIAFAYQYAIWGLPFALMAGYVRQVALVQAALVVPAWLIYAKPFDGGGEYFYVPLMAAIWVGLLVALLRMTVRARARAPEPVPA